MEIAEPAAAHAALVRGRAQRVFIWCNEAIVIAMGAVTVVLVIANVFFRYVLGFSLVWAEEVSQYLMIWITFLGAGLAMRQGRHVAVELLQDRLPKGARHGLRWGVLVATLAFLLTTAVLGCMFVWFARDMETPVLNISMAIPYASVPVGATLLAVHLVLIARAYVDGVYEVAESTEAPFQEGDI